MSTFISSLYIVIKNIVFLHRDGYMDSSDTSSSSTTKPLKKHHQKQDACYKRPGYRESRWEKAVKVCYYVIYPSLDYDSKRKISNVASRLYLFKIQILKLHLLTF